MHRFPKFTHAGTYYTRPLLPRLSMNYATKTSVSFNHEYSNDGANKSHGHVCKETCVLKDCDNKKCLLLCDQRKETEILGHNTHKPPIGRMAKIISDYDAQGKKKSQ